MICEEPVFRREGCIGLNFDSLNKSVGPCGVRCD